MIRVIVRVADANMAANAGGPVHTWHKTFDIVAPELEEFLHVTSALYVEATVIGAEVIESDTNKN